MPQDPFGLGIEPVGTRTPVADPYGLGVERAGTAPTAREEPSSFDWWVEQGLRTAPAVIGSIGGGLAGIPALGLGAIGGGMAGGAAGSALGNILGNWYSGKEFNPAEFGVETALGAVPPILGPAKYAGKGLSAVAKYAGKTALSGAAEGAVVSAGGTPFQQWAQTGDFDAPIEAYLQNAGAGALMGGALGGGIGAWHGNQLGHSAAAPPPVDIPTNTPPPPPDLTPLRQPPIDPMANVQPFQGPEIGPYGVPNEAQRELPLGMPFPLGNEPRQQQLLDLPPSTDPYSFINDIESIWPPRPPADGGGGGQQPDLFAIEGNLFDEGGPSLSQSPYIPPPPKPDDMVNVGNDPRFGVSVEQTPAPPAPPAPTDTLPPTVVVNNPVVELPLYKSQGYVAVEGLRDPQNRAIMVRPELAQNYAAQALADSLQRKNVRPEIPRAVNPGDMVVDNNTVQVPNEKAQNPKFQENMAKNGFVITAKDDTHTTYTREEVDEPAFQRARPDHMYGPSEFHQQMGAVSRMSPQQAMKTAERFDGMIAHIQENNPEKVNTIRQLTEVRDAAIARAEGRTPSMWGTKSEHPYQVKLRDTGEVLYDVDEPALPGFNPDEEPSFAKVTGPKYVNVNPERYQRYKVYDENDNLIYTTYDDNESQRIADEENGYVVDTGEIPPGDEPAFAKVKGGGLVVDADITRAARNLTKDYSSPLSGIMKREGAQNALDAADKMGADGLVQARVLDADPNTGTNPIIEIHDNGSGMDETMLAEKLARIFASGKENDAGATGGKGIGSASYMLGGKHFAIDTVAVSPEDGLKHRIIAGGTPDQFLDPKRGSDWSDEVVDWDTPTGTTIRTELLDDQFVEHARSMMDKIVKFSRNRPSTVLYDRYGIYSAGKDVSEMSPIHGTPVHKFKNTANDKLIGDFTYKNSEIKILIPDYDDTIERNSIDVHYLNNGMYQFSEILTLGTKIKDIPENVIIDLHPLVDEMHNDYPFINTREHVKTDVKAVVDKFLENDIKGPAVNKKKNRTQELYDQMTQVSVPGLKRKSVIFDPGERMTKKELNQFSQSPSVKALASYYDELIDTVINMANKPAWAARLEGVGIVLDPGMNGVHIPNPTTGKSTILINPFVRMEYGLSPKDNAWKSTGTSLHEVAHIGREKGGTVIFDPGDMNDPRNGKYFLEYLNQLNEHGDTGYSSTGHAMDWAQRLGEVYAAFGARNTQLSAGKLESILTGGKGGGYSPELQKLLRLYTTSRGRAASTEDLLSGTGVKQANRGLESEGNVPGDSQADGDGTSTWGKVKRATGWGQGASEQGRQKEAEHNFVKESLAVPTNLTTTMDVSAPGRQGLTQILTPEFWKAGYKMFKGFSEESFKQMERDLDQKDIWKKKVNDDGTLSKSFGETIGLKRYAPASKPGPRAEATASRWLERGIGRTKTDAQGKKTWEPTAGSKAWANTFGVPIRASNRAYITFLNQLGTNRAEKLLNAARDMAEEALSTGSARPGIFRQSFTPEEAVDLNPYHNLVLAKEIADFVNTAIGAGPLKTHVLPFKQTEISLEAAASKLSYIMFSPGLMASRIRMLNPSTYIMASPFVRKQYMKAAMGAATGWFLWSNMIKMAAGDEAQVGDDPTSADFGKVRIGDTRIDTAGGFLQFLTAYARAYEGGYTSSASGEFRRYGEGFQAETQQDMAERFLVNKLNPVAKFAYDVASASQYKPFHVGDRTLQMFIPLFQQDLYELAQERPDLLPLLTPTVALGGGTQTYEKGESVGKFIAPENDWLVEGGGGLQSLMPWNIGREQEDMY